MDSDGLPTPTDAYTNPQVHLCTEDVIATDVRQRLVSRHNCRVEPHPHTDRLLRTLADEADKAEEGNGWPPPQCAVIASDAAGEHTPDLIGSLVQDWRVPVVVVPRGADGLHRGMLAMRAGAMDFVAETCSEPTVHSALDRLVRTAQRTHKEEQARTAALQQLQLLTLREQEVLLLLASGMEAAAVANRLQLAVKTVENHRARLMRKLGFRSVIRMARLAWLAHGNRPVDEVHREIVAERQRQLSLR